MCFRGGMSKTTVFSLSLLCGTAHTTSEYQTEIRKNTVLKYHFPKVLRSQRFERPGPKEV